MTSLPFGPEGFAGLRLREFDSQPQRTMCLAAAPPAKR